MDSKSDPKFAWLQQRATTPDGVYRVLRAAILDGTVPAGGQLREAHIAADLGISRSPLREALTKLEEEGLVVRVPFRGAFVAEVSAQEVAEITSIRLLVEPYAAELSLPALRGPERPRVDHRSYSDLHELALDHERLVVVALAGDMDVFRRELARHFQTALRGE